MKKLFLPLLIMVSIISFGQSADEKAIRKILSEQTSAWNNGDVEGFMKGYWENDSLMFIGKNGITYGWKKTLENYKNNYPDAEAMGQLTFDLKSLKKLSPIHFYVIGKWHLKRIAGDLEGHFTLLFKKINNAWVIVADHSS